MKFEWEQLDGSVIEIDNPDLITEVLNDLTSRLETAKAEGRLMDAAALRSRYESQYGQWRWCMARYYQSERHSLTRFIKNWECVLLWWIECAESSGADAISDVQRLLLSDLSDDLQPRTWEEARRILDHFPESKIPPCGLHAAIEGLTSLITLARSVRDDADRLARNLFDGSIPNQEAFEHFQSRRDELKVQFDSLVAGR